jgi:hypothetical protein
MKRNLKRSPLVLPLVLLASCGGGGLPPSSAVTVSITPSTATVKTGGTVALTGDATGFTASPIVDWWIQESKGGTGSDCGKLDTDPKDFTGCPYGFVMFDDVNQFPTKATYYAPPTPGTYHVVVSMTEICCYYDYLTKTGSTTVTVEK